MHSKCKSFCFLQLQLPVWNLEERLMYKQRLITDIQWYQQTICQFTKQKNHKLWSRCRYSVFTEKFRISIFQENVNISQHMTCRQFAFALYEFHLQVGCSRQPALCTYIYMYVWKYMCISQNKVFCSSILAFLLLFLAEQASDFVWSNYYLKNNMNKRFLSMVFMTNI